MIKVGITGGIGTGKSIVSNIFKQLNIPVYYSDFEAKKLYEDEAIKESVRTIFGAEVFERSGTINKKKLAEIIFKNNDFRDRLNSIIHPAVEKRFEQWLTQHQNKKYILKEAAILFESGTNKGLDYVITVSSPIELRISRIIERDKISREEIENRMKSQMSEEEKIKRSDFVIINNEQELVIPQVLDIHNKLLKIAG